MSFAGLLIVTATIRRAARVTDRYGNDIPDWDDVTDTNVDAWVGPSPHGGRPAAGIGTERRDEDKRIRKLFVMPDVDVTNADRVIVDDVTYEVDDPPFYARNRHGIHHIEIELRAIAG